jgi:signal transduction histidine kinase
VIGRAGREYAYLLTGTVLAVPAFALALLGAVFSALTVIGVGLPFLVGTLWTVRHAPRWFRRPARKLLGWDWPAPRRIRVHRLLIDPAAWKALAYCFLTFPVKLTGAFLGGYVLVAGPVFAAYPVWWWFHPEAVGPFDAHNWVQTWWLGAQGIAGLLVLPWFFHLVVTIDRLLTYALLAPSRAELRIRALEAGRAALQADAAALLRRVERDLHDGTQARLVALGMTLSRIERHVTADEGRQLIGGARVAITEALTELRDIVRGIHPPALDDGLEAALGTLAGRSAVPAELTVDLPRRPSDATASAVYFTTAELLTNAARHAEASRVWIEILAGERDLRLTVRDDGRGGARVDSGGTGLSGLARRAAALDGTLSVQSPIGGPTSVTLALPLP